jgi:predicted MFS family arabinose efflux permease
MAMFSLGTVLLIAALTGSYGIAGTVAAVGSVGYAICSPQAARLADRFGQHRVLPPLAIFFGASSAVFIGCALTRAPFWALLLTGGLAGASMPSLGPMVRARWSVLLGDSPGLHTAFALESVADEMIFIVGPAVVTVLATEVQPAAGVAVAAVACVTGTLLLGAQRGTEPPLVTPPPRPVPRPPADRSRRAPGRGRPARIPARGLVALAPIYLFLGAMFATIDLSTVAFAQERGHKPVAGLILATYAAGSAVGGLWYGSRAWQARLERRFTITLAVMATGVATFWVQPGLLALAAVIFVSGLTISPTLIAGYGLVERDARPSRLTEAMAWLSSTISLGVAAGSATAGHLIDAGGARAGYLFAAGCGAAAVVACLAGQRSLRGARPDAAAGPTAQ